MSGKPPGISPRPPESDLAGFIESFWRAWREADGPEKDDLLLVAVSGGLDSLCLLHLLRFSTGGSGFRIHVAHFDHGMRGESGQDALWVQGLCRAWGVPCRVEKSKRPPKSEEDARDQRYRFLHEVQDGVGARWLLTAHHADDQAETVLFRILRGTGLGGLRGIPQTKDPGVFRPLLSFHRSQLEAYALEVGLRAREDSSNRDLSIPRNFLRHVTLPDLECFVAPGTRANLIGLARRAAEDEEAWGSLLPSILEGLTSGGERGVFIVRSALLAYHPSVQARVMREVVRRQGVNLDESGTRVLLEFTRTGASGRGISLPAGLRLTREFDRFLVGRSGTTAEGVPVEIPSALAGCANSVLCGREIRVEWGPSLEAEPPEVLALSSEGLQFPLWVRGWAPGDRIRLSYGTKKLKKLFGEAGVALGVRDRTPILVDGSGRVLWVVGLAVSRDLPGPGDTGLFYIGIDYAANC